MAPRRPFHACSGCGAFQRSSPTGGAAYGMPLKTRIPEASGATLAIWPASIRSVSAVQVAVEKAAAAKAATVALERRFAARRKVRIGVPRWTADNGQATVLSASSIDRTLLFLYAIPPSRLLSTCDWHVFSQTGKLNEAKAEAAPHKFTVKYDSREP